MIRLRPLAALLGAAALASCEKNAVQDITGTVPGAAVKFYNFGVNAPAVNFYANDRKLTAVLSATGTEATTGTAYGVVAAGGFYTGVTPGQYTFSGRIAATTDKDVAISSVPADVADGRYYSYYLSGIYNTTTKTVDAFIVGDSLPAAGDFSTAYVRFVNAISNASPMTLYARNTAGGSELAVGAAVAYKGAGAFTAVPGGVYDLNTRVAGSATNAISRAAVSFSAGSVYTISARGDITVTSASATNRPTLDNTANR